MLALLATFVLAPQTAPLHLVPTPRTLVRESGQFALGRHAALVVAKSNDDQDAFAAEQLLAERPDSFGWARKKKSAVPVLVGQIGRDKAVDQRLKKLGIKLEPSSSPESYVLVVRPKEIVCAGRSSAGTFYAVQTLKQLVRSNRNGDAIPCVTVQDTPVLQIRGWQDDISRGPIPTLEYLKKEVRELSEYKLNAFTLYTEHVFKLKKHPTIAPKDGISAQEVKELDNYCRKYHVQLIGNFQSFGHFANILRVPGYENLKETSDVITPAKEESYKFLKDVYDEIAPAYSSSLFNINCDETYGLGEGPAKEMVQREGLGNVYAKHINRVADLLKTHGKTPMMWGDIALQHPDIRKNLPKDLIVLTWGYDPRASFVDQIQPFTTIGFKFLVCPGVSCWGQNFPDFESATTNISNFVRDGASNGALGMLNTTWDDTGENLFNNNWYPLVWSAEVSWQPSAGGDTERKQRLATFNEAFPRLFYGLQDSKLSKALWKLSDMRNQPVAMGQSDQAFWRLPWQIDPMAAVNSKGFSQSVMDVTMAIQHARAQASRNADTLDAAEFAVDKMAFLYTQSNGMRELPELLKAPSDVRSELAKEGTDSLKSLMAMLQTKYEKAWRLECRPWWLDRNQAKFERERQAVEGLGFVPFLTPASGAVAKGTMLSMQSIVDGGEIHYTLDGSQPTPQSPTYSGPVALQQSAAVRAVKFMPDGKASPVMTGLYTIVSRPCKIETPWNSFGENTKELAFDGLDSTYFWSYGQVNKDGTFTIVLDDADMIPGIRVVTGHPDHPEDYLHEGVLEVSNDGQKFREVAKFEKGVAETGMIGFRVKAIRIRVTKDNGNWLVIREVQIKS